MDLRGQLIDHVLAEMFSIGLHRDDVKNLEKLSDHAVVRRMGRYPKHNRRDDVVAYMWSWAALLEESVNQAKPALATASGVR